MLTSSRLTSPMPNTPMPETQVYPQLLRIRLRYWIRSLLESFVRIRQSSTALVLFMSLALPALLLIFLPSSILLRQHDFVSNLLSVCLLQLVSWVLIFLQKSAIANRRYQRYLNTFPLRQLTQIKLDLFMILVSNHLFWLMVIPPLVVFLWNADGASIVAGLAKLFILVVMTMSLQVLYLKNGHVPWLRILLFNSVLFSADWLYARGWSWLPLVISVLFMPLFLLPYSTNRFEQLSRASRWMLLSFRHLLLRLSPWCTLYVGILFNKGSAVCRWRLTIAILIVIVQVIMLHWMSEQYRFWSLLWWSLPFLYVINGLYYQIREHFIHAQRLVGSWPISHRYIHLLNLTALLIIETILNLPLLAHTGLNHFISIGQMSFLTISLFVNSCLIYCIIVTAPINALSYTIIVFLPSLFAAFLIF